MTTVIGLFKNQQNVETAVQSLAAANLDNVEFKTISNWERDRETEVELVTSLHSGTSPGGMPVAATMAPSWKLGDEETRFFKRTVQNGGVLLVVEVDDEALVPQVRGILEESGEKVITDS